MAAIRLRAADVLYDVSLMEMVLLLEIMLLLLLYSYVSQMLTRLQAMNPKLAQGQTKAEEWPSAPQDDRPTVATLAKEKTVKCAVRPSEWDLLSDEELKVSSSPPHQRRWAWPQGQAARRAGARVDRSLARRRSNVARVRRHAGCRRHFHPRMS